MSRRAGVVTFVCLGVGWIGLGIYADSWWTILGGVSALAAAAWLVTEAP